MSIATVQIEEHSREYFKADENLQKVVQIYLAERTPENKCLLWDAVRRLQRLMVWNVNENVSPAHMRLMELLPKGMPNPLWENILF